MIVACTLSPIPIDMYGIAKLTSSLARVEERLQLLVNDHINPSIQYSGENKEQQRQRYAPLKINNKIPSHMSWIVKMWHFGQDTLTNYSGDKFDIIWEDSLKILHIYSKQYQNSRKIKIRKEVQEYPNKHLEDAIMDKIEDNDNKVVIGIE